MHMGNPSVFLMMMKMMSTFIVHNSINLNDQRADWGVGGGGYDHLCGGFQK